MKPEPPEDELRRFAGQGTNRNFYLPRLPREFYQGDAVVHWTMPIARRIGNLPVRLCRVIRNCIRWRMHSGRCSGNFIWRPERPTQGISSDRQFHDVAADVSSLHIFCRVARCGEV